MLKRFLILPVAVLMVLAVLNCGDATTPAGKAVVEKGATAVASSTVKAAPITMLKGFDMAKVKGKVTFVELWGVWCPPCIRSMPHVQEMWEKYKVNDAFNLMVVNTAWKGDSPQKVESWLKTNAKYTFPVYYEDRPAAEQFATVNEVNSIPRSLIYDKKGKVRYNGHPMQIPDGLIDGLLKE